MHTDQIRDWLATWARFAERYWTTDPEDPNRGWFGSGYNAWGVQTNQKYAAAMAALAATGGSAAEREHEWARDRAIAALRFSLSSHHSGSGVCADGTRWGHTWISALGVERMMYGVQLLWPHLGERDLLAVERMLVSEADWLLNEHHRGGHEGVYGELWAATGRNVPESNIWNGALLWRTAAMYPDRAQAQAWRERACEFLVNGVSVPADVDDERVLDGKPIRERFRGANFFPSFALDHHNYLNVGYMVICVSNAAILHFDLAQAGQPEPESLHHHQEELWQVLRRMLFSDGRIARIGGDSRVRYTYCQEYLLPSLLYANEMFGDAQALDMLGSQLRLIDTERRANHQDGSFYGSRLGQLARVNPYYFTRLESDRACALGMVLAYHGEQDVRTVDSARFEASVSGGWCAPDHGVALHRSPRRLASVSWRSFGLTQAMCQPPDASDLAEWQLNLAPEIDVLGDAWIARKPSRRLRFQHTHEFDGGFVAGGAVDEGVELAIAEGWTGGPAATSYLAVAALPDDRTMVGIQFCRAANWRIYLRGVKGLHLNVPNDLYNGYARRVVSESGERVVASPPATDEVVDLDSRWAVVDERLGVVGLYGASSLSWDRAVTPRGGRYGSLMVDEVCFGRLEAPEQLPPGAVFVDIGWAVLSEAGSDETATFARAHGQSRLDTGDTDLRAVRVRGADGRDYVLVVNLADEVAAWAPGPSLGGAGTNLVTGERLADQDQILLPAGEASLWLVS